jgi:hypothetical protein
MAVSSSLWKLRATRYEPERRSNVCLMTETCCVSWLMSQSSWLSWAEDRKRSRIWAARKYESDGQQEAREGEASQRASACINPIEQKPGQLTQTEGRHGQGRDRRGNDAALRDGLGGSEARPPLRVVRVVVEVDAVEQQPGAE